MGPGLFGDMFDLNKDGNMDSLEQAAEISFVGMMEKNIIEDQLERSGICSADLEYMSDDEKRDAFRKAGLNETDYENYEAF